MVRSLIPLTLLVACGAGPGAERADAGRSEAELEGLELRVPGAVLRAGHASLGALGLAAFGELAGTAHAEPPPSETPAQATTAPPAQNDMVEVDADRLSLAGQGMGAVLTGHVRLRRGALELSCDRLETRADATGAILDARASGSVRVAQGGLVATAAAARLDLARGEVVLDGPVRLVRAEGTLEGARVVISLTTGDVTVSQARGRLRLRGAEARR